MEGRGMLSVSGVTKHYDGKNGISDICFSCEDGETAAIIGPNGAGKSTLLKVMAGILKADEGSVLINGYDMREYANRKRIGHMPDRMELSRRLTPREFLHMISDYKYGGRFKEEIEQALSAFGLTEYQNQDFQKLSMGNQKKTAIIAAFLGDPQLIILDEPTNGVDTAGIITLKEYIRAAQKEGKIIVFSSHILDFTDGISDNNIFLKNGRIADATREKGKLEEKYRTLYMVKNI